MITIGRLLTSSRYAGNWRSGNNQCNRLACQRVIDVFGPHHERFLPPFSM